uniref:Uncharacterized protein n=1 Tax=Oryza brachyantha TaxID=4533 RepID=J3L004_ORYBR
MQWTCSFVIIFVAQKRELGLLEDEDIANLASAASAQSGEFAEKDASKENNSLEVAKSQDHSERAFYKELVKVIEASDVILEVLDAKDPLGTHCVDMEKIFTHVMFDAVQHLNFKLCHLDLVPKESVEKWLT